MIINKVEICGVNTAKLPVLKEKEMKELLLSIRNGEIECREKFIKGNLRVIIRVIQRYNNRGKSVEELF